MRRIRRRREVTTNVRTDGQRVEERSRGPWRDCGFSGLRLVHTHSRTQACTHEQCSKASITRETVTVPTATVVRSPADGDVVWYVYYEWGTKTTFQFPSSKQKVINNKEMTVCDITLTRLRAKQQVKERRWVQMTIRFASTAGKPMSWLSPAPSQQSYSKWHATQASSFSLSGAHHFRIQTVKL
jgi:hypothetical protein